MAVPFGPWGFNAGGAPQNMYFTDAPYFSFGPRPYTATVGNNSAGTTSIPFVPLIFDNSNSLWADSMLAAGQLSASLRGNDFSSYYC